VLVFRDAVQIPSLAEMWIVLCARAEDGDIVVGGEEAE
jgi:hypothetical protein